jgi:ketosteroid isomerase-like protein
MKRHALEILVGIFLGFIPLVGSAQQINEIEIRNLENLERQAVLEGDTLSLFNKYWSPNMVVNTPANKVGTVEGTKIALKTGKMDYSSFERTIEKITFIGNTAIVMGQEVVEPQGVAPQAGMTLTRRYTNVWIKEGDTWVLCARQATIIDVEEK